MTDDEAILNLVRIAVLCLGLSLIRTPATPFGVILACVAAATIIIP